jgi:hypothetical protein
MLLGYSSAVECLSSNYTPGFDTQHKKIVHLQKQKSNNDHDLVLKF